MPYSKISILRPQLQNGYAYFRGRTVVRRHGDDDDKKHERRESDDNEKHGAVLDSTGMSENGKSLS